MKRRIILSIVLFAGVVMLSMLKFGSTVSAEPPQKHLWDTGIVTLGENQILRVVAVDGELGGGIYGEVVRRFEYQQTGCEAGICKHVIAAQTTTPSITVAPNESVSIDTPTGGMRRISVLSNKRSLRVKAIVFDTSTQRVVSLIDVVDYISSS